MGTKIVDETVGDDPFSNKEWHTILQKVEFLIENV
jgi:hypothetical protein